MIRGIWQYGNALGVPNLGGDVVFHPGFDDNCLVNVIAIGLVAEDEIIHSCVPKNSVGYDLILAGKPTDSSGFGGASFASDTLDGEQAVENKAAVQVPDPFLKNVLIHRKANAAVLRRARELGYEIGMKDLGAGGIMCCSSEMGASGGYGVELNLDNVHIGEEGLPPHIYLCAETQERFIVAVPKAFTGEALRIYNEDWDLPEICSGARASVIGAVIEERLPRLFKERNRSGSTHRFCRGRHFLRTGKPQANRRIENARTALCRKTSTACCWIFSEASTSAPGAQSINTTTPKCRETP